MNNRTTNTLEGKLNEIDQLQGQRFTKLQGKVRQIAAEGITRHLRACDKLNVPYDVPAIREIIDDALNFRKVYAITNDDHQSAA